ncbi:MAG: hypothetical protein E7E72_08605 [Clostridium sp.]|nr:hypothetical protein [Clostridium sp.]
MRLSKNTAIAFRTLIQGHESTFGLNLKVTAEKYKEAGLTAKRFMWDAWHFTARDDRMKLLVDNNADIEVIGGYATNVSDDNIETMLKVALKQYLF